MEDNPRNILAKFPMLNFVLLWWPYWISNPHKKCDQQIKHKFEQFQIFLPYTYYITYMISLEEI